MAGPSLRQQHAHHAIHQGGLSGAVAQTDKVIELLVLNEDEAALKEAFQLIDYWETRILSHADAEEDGFYQETVDRNPDLQAAISNLTRDHDLLRIIVNKVKTQLNEEGLVPEVIQQFHALLVVNAVHSEEEERLIFGE